MMTSSDQTSADSRLLRASAWAYLGGFVLHTGDHLRRGLGSVTPEVLWAGNASGVLAIAAITLVLVHHRLGPWVAAVMGLSAALGVAAVHLTPRWGSLSDSLPQGRVDALTWVAVLIEVGGALAFGMAGALGVHRQRHLVRNPSLLRVERAEPGPLEPGCPRTTRSPTSPIR